MAKIAAYTALGIDGAILLILAVVLTGAALGWWK